jgi:hypothetical protein
MSNDDLIAELRHTRAEVRRLRRSLRLLWALAAGFVLLGLVAFVQQQRINKTQCESRNETRAVVAQVIDRLLDPGDPAHTAEIRERLGDSLEPVDC